MSEPEKEEMVGPITLKEYIRRVRESEGEWLYNEYKDSRRGGMKHPDVEDFIRRNYGNMPED